MDRVAGRITSAGSTVYRRNFGCSLEPTSGAPTIRHAHGREYALRICTSARVSCAIHSPKKLDRGITAAPKRAWPPLLCPGLCSPSIEMAMAAVPNTHSRSRARGSAQVRHAPLTCLIVMGSVGLLAMPERCQGRSTPCSPIWSSVALCPPRTGGKVYCGKCPASSRDPGRRHIVASQSQPRPQSRMRSEQQQPEALAAAEARDLLRERRPNRHSARRRSVRQVMRCESWARLLQLRRGPRSQHGASGNPPPAEHPQCVSTHRGYLSTIVADAGLSCGCTALDHGSWRTESP